MLLWEYPHIWTDPAEKVDTEWLLQEFKSCRVVEWDKTLVTVRVGNHEFDAASLAFVEYLGKQGWEPYIKEGVNTHYKRPLLRYDDTGGKSETGARNE